MVREFREDLRTQVAVQSQLCLLSYTDHGRRQEHDPAVPHIDQLQES